MNPSLKEGWGYVETVSVDASMRGKGVGKALIEFADNQAREHGCHVSLKLVIIIFCSKWRFLSRGYNMVCNLNRCENKK